MSNVLEQLQKGTEKVANFIKRIIKAIKKWLDELLGVKQKGTQTLTNLNKMWSDFKYLDFFVKPPKKPCFLANTLVKTNLGLIAIQDIKQGMQVLSYNFDFSKKEYQPVLNTYCNFTLKYLLITTEKDSIKVTGAHLFYIPQSKQWIAASQLTTEMQLLNESDELVKIKEIEIVSQKETTYNIEVANNHNYYVGSQQHILTHNDSKKLKFNSEIVYEFEFYEFLDGKKEPIYVGQTTQGLFKRGDQHNSDFKKYPNKKEFMKFQRGIFNIEINGKSGPFKMTPFEAAITEMYELQLRGGKRVGNKGLFNKKNPVGERAFNKIKRNFPNMNPCRFYV